MRLTWRGVSVLGAAVVLLGSGYGARLPLLGVVGAMLSGIVLAAVFLVARAPEVGVDRGVYPDRVPKGGRALARLRVRNPTGRRLVGLLATDGVGGDTRAVRIHPLPPGGEATHHYEVPTAKRGTLLVGPLTLHRVDPFGLARSARRWGDTATVRVHPRCFAATAPAGGHPRHHHELTSIDESLRGSTDLKDVREYVPGDETRHVHWKATARTGRLMVRDLADPEQPGFTLLLDDRRDALSDDAFEEAVDVAASLLAAAVSSGHRARLVTSGGLDLPTYGGVGAVRSLLDALTDVGCTADRDAPLVPGVLRRIRSGGGGFAAVTGPATDVRSLASVLGRYSSTLLLSVSPHDAGPTAVSGVRVLSASDAEQLVSRWNEVIA